MKQIILLLSLFMPFVLFSQSESNKEYIKISLDSRIDGCRYISTSGIVLISFEDASSNVPLIVYLTQKSSSTGKEYSIRFSCPVDKEFRELVIRAPQPIYLTQSNGQVLTFQPGGFGITDELNHGPDINGSNFYKNNFCFDVSPERLNDIIQGKIINVRLSPDGTNMIDYNIENNRLSEALSQQIKAIDNQMENPQPVDHKVPLNKSLLYK